MNSDKVILYAEDDDNDVFLMQRAFEKLGIGNPLRIVTDGKQAVAYLEGKEPFADRAANPLPALMLLDLSMPGQHGLSVLQWIKKQPSLSTMPVIVLTSSNQETDVHRAYLLGANGFMVKPGDPTELLAIVKTIQEYWLAETRPAGAFIDFAAVNVRPPKSVSLQ